MKKKRKTKNVKPNRRWIAPAPLDRWSMFRSAIRRSAFSQISGEIEAVGVHHLGPRRHEVLHELLFRIRHAIDFRERTKLRVRAEDQVDAGGGPLDRVGLAIAALIDSLAGVAPLRAHVEQVDEEVVGQRLRLAG